MKEDPEQVLKRFGITTLGYINQTKVKDEMAKALLSMEKDVGSARSYARSLERQIDEYKSKLAEISRDDYGGLEPITDKNLEDGKECIIGLRSKNKLEFYLQNKCPKYREIVAEVEKLRDYAEDLNRKNESLEKDNKIKSKERDRAFSRAVSAEKKLENFIKIQGYFLEGQYDNYNIPFKLNAGRRCVAEIRADHGKIMVCKNNNSSWFFKFGDIHIKDLQLSQTNKKGIELFPDAQLRMVWATDDMHEMSDNTYTLRKS